MKEQPRLPSARRLGGRRIGVALLALASLPAVTHAAAPQNCRQGPLGMPSLDDLAGRDWLGVEGGLYPGGTNRCPEEHLKAGRKLAKSLVPLAADGTPDPAGLLAFAAIGFSFTNQVFDTFMDLAADDPEFEPSVQLVNATWRARDLEDLRDPANDYWTTLLPQQLAAAGVTAEQIQVVWVMEGARDQPADFPDHVDLLADDWSALITNLRANLPNVQLAFLSPVHWQGYAWFAPHAEPYYFEQGFAVREVIARQLAGAPELAYDPAGGAAPAPWLAWGPYFWTDGDARRSDGLSLACTDYNWDGAHLSDSGRAKLAARLLHFVKGHRACAPWSIVAGSSPAERLADTELLGGESAGALGVPRLVGGALPTVPYDDVFMLFADHAAANGSGIVVLSERLLPAGGVPVGDGMLLVEPSLFVPIYFGSKGLGSLPMGEIPRDESLLDLTVYAQLAVFDASAAGGVALSQAIEFILGD